MWSPVEKLLKSPRDAAPTTAAPVVVPLRKGGLAFSDIIEGSLLTFSPACPLPPLTGQTARVEKIRQYGFGEETITTFRLSVGKQGTYSFSVAEDDQGQYLAVSRLLSAAEQDQFFGSDALSFFTEPSSAKTIRCKADLAREGAWAADRYIKSVDWLEGMVSEGKLQLGFRYNLLLNDTGEKALEIEHYPTLKKNQVYLTVYRPVGDILRIAEPSEVPPPPSPMVLTEVVTEKPRPDFRRASDASSTIHIPSTAKPTLTPVKQPEETPPLPSFLLSREHHYLSLDAVIPPETERVRCGLMTAKELIETALTRGVRVRDVMREVVGLESMLSEEVVFEMPLSDEDYRKLAMRYKIRPDHREEIRARLQQELRNKLLGE